MKRSERKYEEHNGVKFNSIYTNNAGSVIRTKGSMGFRVVDNEFKHIAFSFDENNAIDILEDLEIQRGLNKKRA
jgi:hypothetical protein